MGKARTWVLSAIIIMVAILALEAVFGGHAAAVGGRRRLNARVGHRLLAHRHQQALPTL